MDVKPLIKWRIPFREMMDRLEKYSFKLAYACALLGGLCAAMLWLWLANLPYDLASEAGIAQLENMQKWGRFLSTCMRVVLVMMMVSLIGMLASVLRSYRRSSAKV